MIRSSAPTGLLYFFAASNLLVSEFVNATPDKERRTAANLLQTNGVPVQAFIAHGTLWYTHIDAFVYHLLNDSSVMNMRVSRSHLCLMDLTRTLFTVVLGKQNPCKHMIFSGNYSDNKQYERISNILPQSIKQLLAKWRSRIYYLRSQSNICGSISSDIMSQSFAYSWTIHVHSHFKLNVTITSFEVNYILGCEELWAVLFDFIRRDEFSVLGHHCPNSVPRSFYTAHNVMQLYVYILSASLSIGCSKNKLGPSGISISST